MRPEKPLFQLQLVYDVAPPGIRRYKLQHALMPHMALHGAGERNVVVIDGNYNIGYRSRSDRCSSGHQWSRVSAGCLQSGLRGGEGCGTTWGWELSCAEECASGDCCRFPVNAASAVEELTERCQTFILLTSPKDSVARFAQKIQCLCRSRALSDREKFVGPAFMVEQTQRM